jgi:hypothetical protein
MSRRAARRKRAGPAPYTPMGERRIFRVAVAIVAFLMAAALLLSLVIPFAAGSGG